MPALAARSLAAVLLPLATAASLAVPTAAPAAAATAAPTTPRAAVADSRVGQWAPMFADEFNGTAIDTNVWARYSGQPSPIWRLDPKNVTVQNGLATLKSVYDPTTGGYTHAGLCLCRNEPSNHTYGKYEMRSRVSASDGRVVALLWPDEGWPPEIDIMEMGGAGAQGDRQLSTQTLHYDADNKMVHTSFAADLTQWHTVGAEWGPGYIRYTLDGAVMRTVSTSDVPDSPMHFVLQTEQMLDAPQTRPTTWDVDWLRISSYEGGVPTAPAAPAAPTGVPGDTSATVSWTAPADGGSALSSYTVTAQPGGQTRTLGLGPVEPGRTATFTGLTPGVRYAFTVQATNPYGVSAASPPGYVVPTGYAPTATTPDIKLPWQAELGADGSLPVNVTWNGTAGSAPLCAYNPESSSTVTPSWTATPLPYKKATSTKDVLLPGRPLQHRVSATGCNGLTGDTMTSPVMSSTVLSAVGATATGTWSRTSAASSTVERNARLSFRVSGAESLAVVADRGPLQGAAKVYVDGVLQGSFTAYSADALSRRIAYTAVLPDAGTHTVDVVNAATTGRPGLSVDAAVAIVG